MGIANFVAAIALKESVRRKQSELVGATKTEEVAALIILGLSYSARMPSYVSLPRLKLYLKLEKKLRTVCYSR